MSNNDNAMARFLFAILQQKNLKDIDWNKVARNPILAQEITNGHAARMRYSRFRSAMLGLEPQRRNRTNKEKPNRVTKSKKETKDSKSKKEDGVKTESAVDSTCIAESTEDSSPAPRIKQENAVPKYNHRLTPACISTISAATSNHTIQPRLLTPCSDTDVYPTSPAMMPSPTAEMLNSQVTYDFPMNHFSHDQMWSHAPMFPTFEAPYAFDTMHMPFDHQSMHHHGECSSAPTAGEGDAEIVSVKHEHWDNQCI